MLSATFSLLASSALVACNDDKQPIDTEEPGGKEPGGKEPGDKTQEVAVPFVAYLGNAPLDPTLVVPGIGTTDASLQLYDVRFYVSNVELVTADGASVPVELTKSGWQDHGVVLVDLTDLEKEAGTKGMHNHIAGTVPKGDYTGVRFTVGVPFEQNHTFLDTAPAPLNLTSMNWSWRGGRKFIHIDGVTGEGGGAFVHIGSTACHGEIDAITHCDNENRMQVALDWKPGQAIRMDLDTLFAGLDILTNTEGTPSLCMSSPVDPECGPIFDVLGLPFPDQTVKPQQLFVVTEETVTLVSTPSSHEEEPGDDDHSQH